MSEILEVFDAEPDIISDEVMLLILSHAEVARVRSKERASSDEPEYYDKWRGKTLYEATLGKKSSGRPLIDGSITVIHEDMEGESASRFGNSSANVWYRPEGAVALNVTLYDVDALEEHYESYGKSDLSHSLVELRAFYAPFREAELTPVEPEGDRVYTEGGTLVYERVKPVVESVTGQREVARATFPLQIDSAYARLLSGEGDLQLAADDDANVFDVPLPSYIPVYNRGDLSGRYPASFTSFVEGS